MLGVYLSLSVKKTDFNPLLTSKDFLFSYYDIFCFVFCFPGD